DGAENTGSDRFALVADQHAGVGVEADLFAVAAVDPVFRAHDHGTADIALFDAAARNGVLDRYDHDIANVRGAAFRAAQHLNALHLAGAAIVGHFHSGLHLNHFLSSFLVVFFAAFFSLAPVF